MEQPFGICHRLFNFFMGFQRPTMGQPTSKGFAKDPPVHRKPAHEVAQNYLGSIVPVEFDKANAMEEGRAGVREDNRDAALSEPRKGIEIVPVAPSAPKKTVSIKEVAEEIYTPKKKNKASKEKIKQPIDLEKDAASKIPMPLKPILRSASNINERSEEFIRRRREALRSHTTLEPRTPF